VWTLCAAPWCWCHHRLKTLPRPGFLGASEALWPACQDTSDQNTVLISHSHINRIIKPSTGIGTETDNIATPLQVGHCEGGHVSVNAAPDDSNLHCTSTAL